MGSNTYSPRTTLQAGSSLWVGRYINLSIPCFTCLGLGGRNQVLGFLRKRASEEQLSNILFLLLGREPAFLKDKAVKRLNCPYISRIPMFQKVISISSLFYLHLVRAWPDFWIPNKRLNIGCLDLPTRPRKDGVLSSNDNLPFHRQRKVRTYPTTVHLCLTIAFFPIDEFRLILGWSLAETTKCTTTVIAFKDSDLKKVAPASSVIVDCGNCDLAVQRVSVGKDVSCPCYFTLFDELTTSRVRKARYRKLHL